MRLMQSQRMQGLVKAVLLMGMGFFLYGRIADGTLFYYINQKFAGFTLFAMVGLIGVGLAYQFGKKPGSGHAHPEHDHLHAEAHKNEVHEHEAHDHEDGDHDHEGADDSQSHDHSGHVHAGHSHALSWGAVALISLPVILGLLVPPRPLGASALDNRQVVLSAESSALPASVKSAAKAAQERNILDRWRTFEASSDYSKFTNQEAKITGFVYKDPSYGGGYFLATRFVVSCCVADASVVGLVVRWPDASALKDDQWVEVSGKFAPSTLANWKTPLLVAEKVTPVDTPAQPYLYP